MGHVQEKPDNYTVTKSGLVYLIPSNLYSVNRVPGKKKVVGKFGPAKKKICPGF